MYDTRIRFTCFLVHQIPYLFGALQEQHTNQLLLGRSLLLSFSPTTSLSRVSPMFYNLKKPFYIKPY